MKTQRPIFVMAESQDTSLTRN